MKYLKQPDEIYAQSFATIRAESQLDSLPPQIEAIAVRLIHACGMTDLVPDLRFDVGVSAAALAALNAGAPVLADCEMVAAAVIRRNLPAGNDVICTLNEDRVPALAKERGTTRSAAAVELWASFQAGAVVLIGNAPTALFALLEGLDAGAPEPAAIFAFPVGFVGAAESKAALAENPRGVPFMTLAGRRGGSAMAGAALNAVTAGTERG